MEVSYHASLANSTAPVQWGGVNDTAWPDQLFGVGQSVLPPVPVQATAANIRRVSNNSTPRKLRRSGGRMARSPSGSLLRK